MIQPEVKSQQFVSKHSISILMCSKTFTAELLPNLDPYFDIHNEPNLDMLRGYLREQSLYTLPDVILLEVDEAQECFEIVKSMKAHPIFKGLVVILLATSRATNIRALAMQAKVNDLYVGPIPIVDLRERIKFLVKFKLIKPQLTDLSKVDLTYKTPVMKRLFDVFTSALVLILLSPFLAIVAIMVKLDSKGPAFFKSKRVGAGYRIFDFYKFRSMRVGASTELSELSALNQYGKLDSGVSTFSKLKDDPRTTRFGRFIRKFSIDELPQLFNVLKGDMSLVGNRPLPLYEAEMLTSNEWAMRFLGPAGLTGLWQVSRRGRADMSERERKKLDNFYAKNTSFWLDLKILMSTIPAMVQKEKV